MDQRYRLLDSGQGNKLEQFGEFVLMRPCAQAMWQPTLSPEDWKAADAFFSRENGNAWKAQRRLPKEWVIELEGIKFKISPTDFGHLGVFPEHSTLWPGMTELIRGEKKVPHVLNLFAYSGGATLAAAKAGARVCHLDASKGMVLWARENAELNHLSAAPIRWIVDDVIKFLKREVKRGTRYDGIILDPPSFGRGNQGETFKIERDLHEILTLCRTVLSDTPLFILFTTHTQGMSPLVMHHLISQMMHGLKGHVDCGEMIVKAEKGLDVPCGSFAKWRSV